MGGQLLHRLRVSFQELALREPKLLKEFVDSIYGSHPDVTSLVRVIRGYSAK
jgi:hypothetical protein